MKAPRQPLLTAMILFSLLVCAATAQEKAPDKPPEAKPAAAPAVDPLAALGIWVGGSWKGEGKSVASPFTSEGELRGVTTCTWSPNHAFLVCDQTYVIGGREGKDLSLYTWDPEEKTYRFFGINSGPGPVRRPNLTISGNTWTYLNEVTISGHKVQFRTTNIFDGQDHLTYKTEYSSDGGPFQPMNAGAITRVR